MDSHLPRIKITFLSCLAARFCLVTKYWSIGCLLVEVDFPSSFLMAEIWIVARVATMDPTDKDSTLGIPHQHNRKSLGPPKHEIILSPLNCYYTNNTLEEVFTLLFLLSCLNASMAGYNGLDRSSFLFNTLKILNYYLLVSSVAVEKFYFCSFVGDLLFTSRNFYKPFLVFDVLKLYYIVSECDGFCCGLRFNIDTILDTL